MLIAGETFVEDRVLGALAERTRPCDCAVVAVDAADEDLHQSRLPRTVFTDQTDDLTGSENQIRAAENFQ